MELSIDEPVDEDDSSDDSSISSSASPPIRLGKYEGHPSTWRDFTHEERLVSSSLTQLRDQNLSAHLYNAHALKRCYYGLTSDPPIHSRTWSRRDSSRGRQGKRARQENSDDYFLPPRVWTAWPLPAEVVPRAGEAIGPEDVDEDDLVTMRRPEPAGSSQELEDVLTATTLNIARENFVRRKWEPKADLSADEDINEGHMRTSRASKRSHESDQESDQESSASEERVLSKEPALQLPVVSADDETSGNLLQPIIRHNLAKLDHLLMALHHARQACMHYGRGQTESTNEIASSDSTGEDNDMESHSSSPKSEHSARDEEGPRRRGRPPKMLMIPQNDVDLESPQGVSKRGRPRKVWLPLQGETHNEMMVRIAKVTHSALPFQAPSNSGYSSTEGRASRSRSRTRSRSRSRSRKRPSSAKDAQRSLGKLSLRDWSEVMGTAALVGFPPEVVQRATQRCANLFEEGMVMHSLVENPLLQKHEPILYTPEVIPDLDDDNNSKNGESSSSQRQNSRSKRRTRHAQSAQNQKSDDIVLEMDAEQGASYICLFSDCPRHSDGFKRKRNLVAHMKTAHKLTDDELQDTLEGDKDEMFGGVHVDEFLKQIKPKPGWRGHTLNKRSSSGSHEERQSSEDSSSEES